MEYLGYEMGSIDNGAIFNYILNYQSIMNMIFQSPHEYV